MLCFGFVVYVVDGLCIWIDEDQVGCLYCFGEGGVFGEEIVVGMD